MVVKLDTTKLEIEVHKMSNIDLKNKTVLLTGVGVIIGTTLKEPLFMRVSRA